MALKTDYVDDVLDTNVNTTRVFDILDSNNSTVEQDVHFDDKTTYTQNGTSFGSADINATNTAVNSHESNFAPIESDATSSANAYSVGDHLVLNNVYYKVISAIAVSDALTVGTNIQQANIGDEITQLNTDLTGNYLLKSSYERITLATQSGSKTLATLMSEALTTLRATTIPSGEYWEIKGIDISVSNATYLMTPAMPTTYTSFSNVTIKGFNPDLNNSYIGLRSVYIGDSINEFAEAQISIANGTVDFHQSFKNNVPTYGISIYVDKFVKID